MNGQKVLPWDLITSDLIWEHWLIRLTRQIFSHAFHTSKNNYQKELHIVYTDKNREK